MTYLRGQVSKMTGLNAETLRFYEKNGLISVPERTNSGYRLYHEAVLNRLEFIKQAKSAGFSLDEIRHLLSLLDNKVIDQPTLSELLERKIKDLDQAINTLHEMKTFLLKVKANMKNPEKCQVLQSLLGESKKTI